MRAQRHRHHDEELEFQIAPMIDVLLVILIFFITITSASVLRLNRNIRLPVAPNASDATKTWSEALVHVAWNPQSASASASILNPQTGLEEHFADFADITGFLKPFVIGDRYRIVVRADRDTPAGVVQKVIGACVEAGVADVTFSAVNIDR